MHIGWVICVRAKGSIPKRQERCTYVRAGKGASTHKAGVRGGYQTRCTCMPKTVYIRG